MYLRFPHMLLYFIHLIPFLLAEVKLSYASSLSRSLMPTVSAASPSDTREHLTATPTLSCYPQFQDPDQGILSIYCICDGTVSLPQMTPTSVEFVNDEFKSCAYETIPVSNTKPIGVISTC